MEADQPGNKRHKPLTAHELETTKKVVEEFKHRVRIDRGDDRNLFIRNLEAWYDDELENLKT